MRSHINILVLEGHLLEAATQRDDGTVEVTLQSHEAWEFEGKLEARENMLGLIALPNTRAARWLVTAKPKTHVIITGSLRTFESTGPRGGKVTKTKIRIKTISLPV